MSDLHPRNIYIASLPKRITETDLRGIFEPFGQVISAKVMLDAQGQSRGFGFVLYANPQSATAALENLAGLSIDGVRVQVRRARLNSNTSVNFAAFGPGEGPSTGGTPNAPPVSMAPGSGQPTQLLAAPPTLVASPYPPPQSVAAYPYPPVMGGPPPMLVPVGQPISAYAPGQPAFQPVYSQPPGGYPVLVSTGGTGPQHPHGMHPSLVFGAPQPGGQAVLGQGSPVGGNPYMMVMAPPQANHNS